MKKKVRIVFCVMKLVCGGSEKALFDLVSLLNKAIFEISVFVLEPGGEYEKNFLDAGINVIHPYARLKEGKKWYSRVFNHFFMKKTKRLLTEKSKKLLYFSSRKRFDIVVSYQMYFSYDHIAYYKHAKHIKYFHENVLYYINYLPVRNCLVNITYDYNKIICVSNNSKNGLESCIGKNEKVITLYNPINWKDIIEKANISICNSIIDKPYIIAVGRLSKEKGFERLITVFSKLTFEGYRGDLVIIGDGPLKNELSLLIQNNNLSNRVFLLGYQENPYPFIKKSVALVISSYTEGLPLVAFEALCLSVPVVSCYPSIKEAFGDFECGIITNNNENDLLDGLKKIVFNEKLYRYYKKQAELRSNIIKSDYFIKKVENQYLNL